MPAKRPNTRPVRKTSKRGHPTVQQSSQSQRMPAGTATGPVDDDRLQSAIDAAIEGILPRIVCKVSTLLGGEGMPREGAPPPPHSWGGTNSWFKRGDRPEPGHTPSPGVRLPNTHWLRWTGPWPGRLRHRTQTRLSIAHWHGGGYPSPGGSRLNGRGTRPRVIAIGVAMGGPGAIWDTQGPPSPEEPGLSPYTSPAARSVADRPFTATSTIWGPVGEGSEDEDDALSYLLSPGEIEQIWGQDYVDFGAIYRCHVKGPHSSPATTTTNVELAITDMPFNE